MDTKSWVVGGVVALWVVLASAVAVAQPKGEPGEEPVLKPAELKALGLEGVLKQLGAAVERRSCEGLIGVAEAPFVETTALLDLWGLSQELLIIPGMLSQRPVAGAILSTTELLKGCKARDWGWVAVDPEDTAGWINGAVRRCAKGSAECVRVRLMENLYQGYELELRKVGKGAWRWRGAYAVSGIPVTRERSLMIQAINGRWWAEVRSASGAVVATEEVWAGWRQGGWGMRRMGQELTLGFDEGGIRIKAPALDVELVCAVKAGAAPEKLDEKQDCVIYLESAERLTIDRRDPRGRVRERWYRAGWEDGGGVSGREL